MSVLALPGRSGRRARRPNYRLRKVLIEAGSILLGIVVAVWSLIPVYNMLFIAFNPDGYDEFSGYCGPSTPTLDAFIGLWNGGVDGRRVFLAAARVQHLYRSGRDGADGLGRLARQLRRQPTAADPGVDAERHRAPTYVIPSSTLVIPFYRIMHQDGLMENPWSVDHGRGRFATPYAILVLQQAGKLIPIELDEAARIDGAVGLAGLREDLCAADGAGAGGGRHLCAALRVERLSLPVPVPGRGRAAPPWRSGSSKSSTSDNSPYNYMMAMSVVYSIPPVVIFYALRRYMASGLTRGGVKG